MKEGSSLFAKLYEFRVTNLIKSEKGWWRWSFRLCSLEEEKLFRLNVGNNIPQGWFSTVDLSQTWR